MSNKSRMPASASRGIEPMGLAKVLAQAAQHAQSKAAEMKEAEMKEAENMQPDVEDLNMLPMPATQVITDKGIEWTWPLFGGTIFVFGFLFSRDVDRDEGNVKDNDFRYGQKGQYIVQLKMPNSAQVWGMTDCAKEVGQALISAENWVKIWKDHAGFFLEQELFAEPKRPRTELDKLADKIIEVVDETTNETADEEETSCDQSYYSDHRNDD